MFSRCKTEGFLAQTWEDWNYIAINIFSQYHTFIAVLL